MMSDSQFAMPGTSNIDLVITNWNRTTGKGPWLQKSKSTRVWTDDNRLEYTHEGRSTESDELGIKRLNIQEDWVVELLENNRKLISILKMICNLCLP